MSDRTFYENGDGVHLIAALSDYTLCGDALEGDQVIGLEACERTEKRVVTCSRCADVIEHCRGVRFRRDGEQ